MQHKLRHFALFKSKVQIECYLLMIQDVYKRMLISCLRMGVLPLRIETGRYEGSGIVGARGIPIEFRVCQCCVLNKVEDEIHFLLECPCFESERKHLVHIYQEEMAAERGRLESNVVELFTYLMQSKSVKLWRALAEYIVTAYKKRVNVIKALHVS